MKKTIFFTLCLSALITFSASAKIWRVNNNPGIVADFTTLQAAHDDVNVMAGDTLHIEPSGISYGALHASKKLIILGNGYFLNENLNNQANPLTAMVDSILFDIGSDGSIISGLHLFDQSPFGTIYIGANNITVSRNKIAAFISVSSVSNIVITQNFINGINIGVSTNILITNNHVDNISNYDTTSSGVIANNILQVSLTSNFIIQNNIYLDSALVTEPLFPNTYVDNIASNINGNGLPSGNGNQNGVSWDSIFVDSALNTTDGKWQLKPSSPAIGAGIGDVDCGMFGGSNPYKLSGLPSVPSIYSLSAPENSNGNTLLVNISVKSNN